MRSFPCASVVPLNLCNAAHKSWNDVEHRARQAAVLGQKQGGMHTEMCSVDWLWLGYSQCSHQSVEKVKPAFRLLSQSASRRCNQGDLQ